MGCVSSSAVQRIDEPSAVPLQSSSAQCFSRNYKTISRAKHCLSEIDQVLLRDEELGELVSKYYDAIGIFLNVQYRIYGCFDEVIVSLFSDQKSKELLGIHSVFDRICRNCISHRDWQEELQFLEDILCFVTSYKVQYVVPWSGAVENVIDFPLKHFGLCPCIRRPIYVALYINNPVAVKTLMKFGALLPLNDRCICEPGQIVHPLERIIQHLEDGNDALSCASAAIVKHQRVVNMRSTLECITVDLSYSSNLWMMVQRSLKCLKKSNFGSYVPTLKHISRAAIRSEVRKWRSLPHSLYKLPLPDRLHVYLTLE